jgi:phosphatidate cytidylyltransferase
VSRIASAVVLIGIFSVTLFVLPPWATLGLAVLAAAAAGSELGGLARAAGAPVPALFAGASAAIATAALAWPDFWPGSMSPDALATIVLAAMLAAGLIVLGALPPGPAALIGTGALLLAPFYVGLPLGTLASIRAMCGPEELVWLVAVIAGSDSAQYYTGRAIGKTKLAPVVSPGKTVEGAIGGLVAAPIIGALAGLWALPDTPMYQAALVALVLAAFGIAGDLFESLLKRSAGMKDSSTLIPGHGGVLDRLDAYLFAGPVFYLLVRYVQ